MFVISSEVIIRGANDYGVEKSPEIPRLRSSSLRYDELRSE